jgi:hypothetical protein
MSLLAGLPESSGGSIRSYPQPASSSSPWMSMLTYHTGVKNMSVDGSSSETYTHPTIINQSMKANEKATRKSLKTRLGNIYISKFSIYLKVFMLRFDFLCFNDLQEQRM